MHPSIIRSARLAALAIAAVSQIGPAIAGTEYLVTDLGLSPGLDSTYVLALNKTARVTGFGNSWSYVQAIVGAAGMLHSGPTLGGKPSHGMAINSLGQVAGCADLASGLTHAFVFKNGTTSDLGTLGGDYSCAYGVNDHGLVVGSSSDQNNFNKAFRWSAGVMKALPDLTPNMASIATAVNSSDTIAGQSMVGLNRGEAVIWQQGLVSSIDPGSSVSKGSIAYGLNDTGMVVGLVDRASDSQPVAFSWRGGKMSFLPSPWEGWSRANGVNRKDVIVGFGCDSSGLDCRALIWQLMQATDLNLLMEAASGAGVKLVNATGINDAGQIVAIGTYKGQHGHSFLLTPQ